MCGPLPDKCDVGPTAPADSSAAPLSSRASFRQAMRDFVPRGAILFCFYLFFALLLVTRRFDCVQNPQFWRKKDNSFSPMPWNIRLGSTSRTTIWDISI